MKKKDDEQGPSEEADSGEHGLTTEKPEGKCVGTLDMNRQLPAEAKWLCIGKMPDKGVALFIPDDWEPDELSGFIHRVANPDFIITNINNSRK